MPTNASLRTLKPMKHFVLVLASLVIAVSLAAETFERSFETDLYGSFSYKDDFGGLGLAPGLAFTYGYAIGPTSELGLTLVRFSPWLAAASPVYQISYGVQYKHFWSPNWGDLGPWTPFLTYSLLLDQTLVTGTVGRGMAHHTRLGVGTNYLFLTGQHLVLETGWAQSSYTSLGEASTRSLSSVYASLGWRWLF